MSVRTVQHYIYFYTVFETRIEGDNLRADLRSTLQEEARTNVLR